MTFCSESTVNDYTHNFLRKIDLFGDLLFEICQFGRMDVPDHCFYVNIGYHD